MDYAIELSDLTKRYTDFTLDKINLKLPTGSIMGFVGENGAGKSTTIKLILDLVHKDEGTIKIFGKDENTFTLKDREQIGVVMDDSCFPEVLNAIEVGKIQAKLFHNWDMDTYKQLTQKFSIPMKKPIKDYSKGMKMKLNIACALSHKAKLLIMDEATSGLDPVVRDEILDIFLDFIQDETHSILLSSHITSDLEKICDYITLIHKGKIVISQPKDELVENYGILKCTEKELHQLKVGSVIRYRKNEFGVEALVVKDEVPKSMIVDRASIEDIMLFNIRGQKL